MPDHESFTDQLGRTLRVVDSTKPAPDGERWVSIQAEVGQGWQNVLELNEEQARRLFGLLTRWYLG